jgi:hypothetical protein
MHNTLLETIKEITLQLIIEIYCTPGQKFSSKHFKDEMKDLGSLPVLVIHKLFSALESWRREAPDWTK